MKRPRSDSEVSDLTVEANSPVVRGKGEVLDELGVAELLRHLRSGNWESPATSVVRDEEEDQDSGTEFTRPAPARSGQPKKHKASRAAFSSGATRSYVWRGPSRRLGALKQHADELEQRLAAGGRHPAACSGSSSDVEEDEEVSHSGHKQKDKDWAALTTWLRMNLHHPRTNKKLVLFVGQQQSDSSWRFQLNPGLCWDDVSLETKLRLKTIMDETCAAFKRKYPTRPVGDWVKKMQKYRVPATGEVVSVPLCDMIYSLRDVYQQFEGCGETLPPQASPERDAGQQQQHEQLLHSSASNWCGVQA